MVLVWGAVEAGVLSAALEVVEVLVAVEVLEALVEMVIYYRDLDLKSLQFLISVHTCALHYYSS